MKLTNELGRNLVMSCIHNLVKFSLKNSVLTKTGNDSSVISSKNLKTKIQWSCLFLPVHAGKSFYMRKLSENVEKIFFFFFTFSAFFSQNVNKDKENASKIFGNNKVTLHFRKIYSISKSFSNYFILFRIFNLRIL